MLDTNKLDEIQINFDTINMLKELKYSNEDILNELSNTLTAYPNNLLECLCNDINNTLYQSVVLRLKLQERLKLDNTKLLNSFNKNLHPLINYLLKDNSEVKKVEKVVEKKVESDNESLSDSENNNENVDLNEYMDNCIIKEKGHFLVLNDVYDDYSEWHEAEEKDNKLEKDNFSKLFQQKFGKSSTKNKVKGWKDLNTNIDD
tara:strand:- start:1061 stop:1669 length:609 start_codon:yes stop_codon:yes gene_type:complete